MKTIFILLATAFLSVHAYSSDNFFDEVAPECFRNSCKIWADIDKQAQVLYLYIDGVLTYTWKTSTGIPGRETPDMDMHPDGRIYDRYSSDAYPGGHYKRLGNMPYAVFVYSGIAIHGAIKKKWKKLGQRDSFGCIRLHPDNAFIFNRLVRKNGILNVWITAN